MKETSIRPEVLIEEANRLNIKDVDNILKYKSQFKEVTCPACTSSDHFHCFEKNGFSFVKCHDCKTVFINPRPTSEMLNQFYLEAESIKYWNDFVFPSSETVRREQIFAPRAQKVIEFCRAYQPEAKLLVDVGAGFGTFCEEIKKYNFFKEVIAVEASSDLAETCRKKGIKTINKPIEDLEFNHVNVITNFELIEHLYSPEDFLAGCYRALAPNGLLILSTPNIAGFDMAILGQQSSNIDGPHHLNYFCQDSLRLLLSRCGFQALEVLTPGKLDAEIVRNHILQGDLNVSGQEFFQQVLIDRWDELGTKFQHFLAENGLSSHMWVVAQKS